MYLPKIYQKFSQEFPEVLTLTNSWVFPAGRQDRWTPKPKISSSSASLSASIPEVPLCRIHERHWHRAQPRKKLCIAPCWPNNYRFSKHDSGNGACKFRYRGKEYQPGNFTNLIGPGTGYSIRIKLIDFKLRNALRRTDQVREISGEQKVTTP